MTSPTLAQLLADLAENVTMNHVPDEVGENTELRILDILGIGIAATTLPTSQAISEMIGSQGGVEEATAIGYARRLPATNAAFLNGVLAHSLDYDDTHLPSILHPSASVVPASLAMGEATTASGTAVVDAAAVGIEVAVRLGMAGYDPDAGNSVFFEHGQHATSICGTIGAAVSASMLADLPANRIVDAIGIAASMAGGILEGNRRGGTVKRIHCGWAAQAGITAAKLAEQGITGPDTVLEGRFGFFEAFIRRQHRVEPLIDGLGETWSLLDIFFKPYPANHFTHTSIDAAIAVRDKLEVSALERITVKVAAPTVRTIGEPIERKRQPASGYEAQFSAPYAVAAGLLGGGGLGVGLSDYSDDLVNDPERLALMAITDVVADSECDDIYPFQFPSKVDFAMTDGEVITEEVLVNRGGPDNPLSPDELGVKFSDNATLRMDDETANRVRADGLRLRSLPEIDELMEPLKLQTTTRGENTPMTGSEPR